MKTQMELTFDSSINSAKTCRPIRRRSLPGARWWFQQMHTVVDRAFDWSRTAQARPEQTYISFGSRTGHGRAR